MFEIALESEREDIRELTIFYELKRFFRVGEHEFSSKRSFFRCQIKLIPMRRYVNYPKMEGSAVIMASLLEGVADIHRRINGDIYVLAIVTIIKSASGVYLRTIKFPVKGCAFHYLNVVH